MKKKSQIIVVQYAVNQSKNDEKGKYFMIDAGGGNGILTQLEKMNIPLYSIEKR